MRPRYRSVNEFDADETVVEETANHKEDPIRIAKGRGCKWPIFGLAFFIYAIMMDIFGNALSVSTWTIAIVCILSGLVAFLILLIPDMQE